MQDPIVPKFINDLKLAGKPYLIDGSRIVCGGAVMLTVEPDIDAEFVTEYRLELPDSLTVPQEFPYVVLFVTSVFGVGVLRQIGGILKKCLFDGKPFTKDIGDYRLKGFSEGDQRVLLFEHFHPRPTQ